MYCVMIRLASKAWATPASDADPRDSDDNKHVLPALLQSSSVNFDISGRDFFGGKFVAGILRDFSDTHYTTALKFRGNFGAFFVTKFVPRKRIIRANFVLQTCRRKNMTHQHHPHRHDYKVTPHCGLFLVISFVIFTEN